VQIGPKTCSFVQNPCHFDVNVRKLALNVRFFLGHFVTISFVFIHIPALNVFL
jgi:hypothetical protein